MQRVRQTVTNGKHGATGISYQKKKTSSQFQHVLVSKLIFLERTKRTARVFTFTYVCSVDVTHCFGNTLHADKSKTTCQEVARGSWSWGSFGLVPL